MARSAASAISLASVASCASRRIDAGNRPSEPQLQFGATLRHKLRQYVSRSDIVDRRVTETVGLRNNDGFLLDGRRRMRKYLRIKRSHAAAGNQQEQGGR